MTYKKNILLSSLAIVTFIAPSTIKSFQVPNSINNAHIYVKQRAKFTKVMISALARHCWDQTLPQEAIENYLAKIYTALSAPTHKGIHEEVQALRNAILNNKWINISPREFLLGASSSAYQIEGGLDETSASARFYKNKAQLPIAGDAIDFYHRSKTDIEQMKNELGINSFRMSFAWNRIQPSKEIFNKQEIEKYKKDLRYLLSLNMKPMGVFHHYDVPQWFEDLGGFEKPENGKYFQEFCLKMYEELAEELGESLISMCNAPEGPAFKGYFTGDGTPGEKDNLHKTHMVIANMYYELVDTALAIQKRYDVLKKNNPKLKKPSIGTQINVVLIDPHDSSQLNWKSRLKTAFGCAMADYVQSGGPFDFLVSGHYCMWTPNANFMKQAKGVNVYRYHPKAAQAFDWIGVNFYSNRFLNGFNQIPNDELIEQDEERYTDNKNYRNYPEGIYRAVKLITENVARPLGKIKNRDGKPLPVIVTENGIATKDHDKRIRYFQRALTTITQLIKDGYPVVGYLPWTSHDNYEWPTADNPQGFNSKNYGFFAVNFDKNSPDYLRRTLKEGSRYYATFAQEFFKSA